MEFPQIVFQLLIAYQLEIANSGAILMYSGTPGPGNLVISLAPSAGTDRHGNPYPEGLDISGALGSIQIQNDGTGTIQEVMTTGNPNTGGTVLRARAIGAGTAEFDAFGILGPKTTSATTEDNIQMLITSNNLAGTGPASFTVTYVSGNGASSNTYLEVTYLGVVIEAGSIAAVEPGTGTGALVPAVSETWHAATLGTGWANSSGYVPLEYRVTADGMIEIQGNIMSTSATPAGTIMTLPVGWRPGTHTRTGACTANTSPSATAEIVDIATTGGVIMLTPPTASGVPVHVYIRIPQ